MNLVMRDVKKTSAATRNSNFKPCQTGSASVLKDDTTYAIHDQAAIAYTPVGSKGGVSQLDSQIGFHNFTLLL
jgi:hypothetical protein